MMWRRIFGGSLLVAFVAPVLLSASSNSNRIAEQSAAHGAGCCAAISCCASGDQCAAGGCAEPASTSAAGDSQNGTRLAAGCGGATPAMTIADRDPMTPASKPALPGPPCDSTVIPHLVWSTSGQADDPIPHPPRA